MICHPHNAPSTFWLVFGSLLGGCMLHGFRCAREEEQPQVRLLPRALRRHHLHHSHQVAPDYTKNLEKASNRIRGNCGICRKFCFYFWKLEASLLHAVFGMIFLTLGYVRLVLVFFCFIVHKFYKVRVVCLMSAVLRS